MDYYRYDNGIRILTFMDETIEKRIQEKIKDDSDYNKRFRTPLLDEINVKYKDNPYGLDVNMIPVRLKDRNKQTAYGWFSDEANNIININTDTSMLLLQQSDLYTITKQRIMKRYSKSCTARSVFTRIITIVEAYKEEQERMKELASDTIGIDSDVLSREEESEGESDDGYTYGSDGDII